MKQQITYEQLSELNKSQMDKLIDWYIKTDPEINAELPPLLSIGEMIEFLDEKEEGYIDGDHEHIIGNSEPCNNGFSIGWSKYDELCDVLWEAVKNKLKG